MEEGRARSEHQDRVIDAAFLSREFAEAERLDLVARSEQFMMPALYRRPQFCSLWQADAECLIQQPDEFIGRVDQAL